jgi:hypothetical protein
MAAPAAREHSNLAGLATAHLRLRVRTSSKLSDAKIGQEHCKYRNSRSQPAHRLQMSRNGKDETMTRSQLMTPDDITGEQSSHQGTEATDLARALQTRLEGEVRFDAGSRALYATDLSIYRQPPVGVVIPRSIEDVIATVEECRNRGVPILGRGKRAMSQWSSIFRST